MTSVDLQTLNDVPYLPGQVLDSLQVRYSVCHQNVNDTSHWRVAAQVPQNLLLVLTQAKSSLVLILSGVFRGRPFWINELLSHDFSIANFKDKYIGQTPDSQSRNCSPSFGPAKPGQESPDKG